MLATVTLKIDIPEGPWDHGNVLEFCVRPLIRVQAFNTGEVEVAVVNHK